MAQYLTIARPYAKAIFKQSVATPGMQPAWSQVLQMLALLIKDQQMMGVIQDPSSSDETVHAFILSCVTETLSDAVTTLGEQLVNFLRLLIIDKRLVVLADINCQYQQLLAEQQHLIEVNVSSAFELSEQQTQQLQHALEKRFASKVSLKTAIDPTVMGGLLIRTGNWVLDGSVQGKINRLYQALVE